MHPVGMVAVNFAPSEEEEGGEDSSEPPDEGRSDNFGGALILG